MEIKDIFKDINKIFSEVFEKSDMEITVETSAKDVDEWDSLNHVLLIAAIEKHFRIKFELSDMLYIKNIGDIRRSVINKLSRKSKC